MCELGKGRGRKELCGECRCLFVRLLDGLLIDLNESYFVVLSTSDK